jgi:hypothetical protein
MKSRRVFEMRYGKSVIFNRIIQANQAKVGKEWRIPPILWSKVKAKATLGRKTMREVIFKCLKRCIAPVEITASPDKKKKEKKKAD